MFKYSGKKAIYVWYSLEKKEWVMYEYLEKNLIKELVMFKNSWKKTYFISIFLKILRKIVYYSWKKIP